MHSKRFERYKILELVGSADFLEVVLVFSRSTLFDIYIREKKILEKHMVIARLGYNLSDRCCMVFVLYVHMFERMNKLKFLVNHILM